MTNLFQLKDLYPDYQPRAAPHFRPDTIVITKGSFQSAQCSGRVEAICRVYPKARIIDKSALPHNRVELDSTDPLELHYKWGRKRWFWEYIRVLCATAMKIITPARTVLSWSLNPPEIASKFELDVPSPDQRIAAMRKCAEVGYPVRAVIMPVIPVDGWRHIYSEFLRNLVNSVPLSRITLGQICSYSAALRLTERKLGAKNPISKHLERKKSTDGRLRFPSELRTRVYRRLIQAVRQCKADLPIGLCMEEKQTFEALDMKNEMGVCNCAL